MSFHLKFLRQTGIYFIANIGGMLAGLISMPILTRVLTQSDYGKLSLILLSVNFLSSFARLGIPQSVARHFPEYAKAGKYEIQDYVSSLFHFCCITSIIIVLVFIFFGCLSNYGHFKDWSSYIYFIGLLLCMVVVYSLLSELYRAQNKSVVNSGLLLANRYATLAFSLFFIFFVTKNLNMFLFGRVLAQFLVITIFIIPLILSGYLKLIRINYKIVKEGIRYGFPLSLATAGGFFIAYGDRYVIQSLLNSVQVARYSLPYDIIYQIESVLTTPIRMAIVPIIFNVIINQGEIRASTYLSQVIRGYIFILIPVVAGISFLGEEILILMGSEKYADSSEFIPFLSIGVLFGGMIFLFTIGLSYQKKTNIIALLTLVSGVINIILNVFLIPIMGTIGAAWATLITYMIHIIVAIKLSSKVMKLKIFDVTILKSFIGALLMICGLWIVGKFLSFGIINIIVKIFLGVFIFATVSASIDRKIRRYILDFIKGRISLRQIVSPNQ